MERIQKQMQAKLVLMEKEKEKYEKGLISGEIEKGFEGNMLGEIGDGDEEVKRKDKKNKKKKKNKKNRVKSKEKSVDKEQEIEGITIDDVKVEINEENKESKLPKIKYNNESSKAPNNINLNANSNISTETIGFYHHKPKSL
jgi:hypothetical protein